MALTAPTSTGFVTKVELRESGDEYLLFVPIALKERAKAIEGRRWDPDRRCWVYPRTKRMYEALIGEFADEAVVIEISPPKRPLVPQLQPPVQSPAAESGEVAALKLALASEQARREALEKRIDELSQQFSKDRDQAVRGAGPRWLKHVVKTANAGDAQFESLVQSASLDEGGASKIASALEAKLCLLQGYDPSSPHPSLHELINQARDSERLPSDGYYLCQLIRTHRNVLTHQNTDSRTRPARVALIFAAAGLLWPLLPE